ncbi:hypothetical protein MCA0929 [Methylococcus capsulatus str. Bath]|uniref:Uncharacterized protein n=1 Tax=Methylococcus capsulatus (strain ATCC 33009 / NCIMB 11132 / Bath) TaxID=243233 RepID=Q60AD5_METCA|nr:hypothetical protein MCA0929 [Methylococcus capsulatus str. Bath]
MFCRNPRLHRGWRRNIRDPTRRRVIGGALSECIAERRTEPGRTQDGAGRRRQGRRQFFAPEGDGDVPSGFAKNGDAPADRKKPMNTRASGGGTLPSRRLSTQIRSRVI